MSACSTAALFTRYTEADQGGTFPHVIYAAAGYSGEIRQR